jgi:hypothetical protein
MDDVAQPAIQPSVAMFVPSATYPELYPESGLTLAISQEEAGLLAGVSRQRIPCDIHH